MTDINRFFGKSEKATIKDNAGADVEIEIPALRGKEIRHLMAISNATDAETKKIDFNACFDDLFAIYRIIMKHNFPTATDADLDSAATMENLMQVLNAYGEKTGRNIKGDDLAEFVKKQREKALNG